MILKIFAIYDDKAEAFIPPFFVPTVAVAIRAFESEANNPDANFYKYPSDYTLFELGEYDDSNASFDLHATPRSLGLALQFKKDN